MRVDASGHHRATRSVVRWLIAGILGALLLTGCQNPDAAEPAPEVSPTDSDSDSELTFPADGLELAGTLRLPAGSPPPATVVIVGGSGPQSRDGWAPGQLGLTFPRPVPVYRELAEGLVAAGYGVLTWDKRTCGPFNNCAANDYPTPSEDLEFDTLVNDVSAVVAGLAERDDLGELVVLGHSQGGTIAAAVAAESAAVAGVALVATPQPDIVEAMAVQADTLADLVATAGLGGTPADDAVTEARSVAAEVAEVAGGDLTGPPIGGATREFWAGWIVASQQAPARIAELDIPVVAVGGGQDWNVPPAQVEAWEQYLPAQGEVRMLPGITHPLTRLHTDDVAAITAEDLGTEVDEAVVAALVEWLSAAFPAP